MPDPSTTPSTSAAPLRYRCSSCGNLTRFDVTSTRRTTAFHHYTVGGVLEVEDEQVLSETVEDVVCRWCGTGSNVVAVDEASADQNTEAALGEER